MTHIGRSANGRKRVGRGLIAALVLVAAAACNTGPEEHVFTEHRFERAAHALTLPAGSNCTKNGPDGCESGLCLHVRPEQSDGWLCSARCETDATCPESWRCVRAHPEETQRVCVPAPGKKR